jgi:hypothetical protein
MKEQRKLSPKALGSESRMKRARKLAEASLPIVADLYLAHMQACATNRDAPRRRPRRKSAPR